MSLNKQASNLGVKGWAICIVAIILLWFALYWRFNQAEKNALVLAQQHAADSVLAFGEVSRRSFEEIDHLLLNMRQNVLTNQTAMIETMRFYRPIMNIPASLIGVSDSAGNLVFNTVDAIPKQPITVVNREYFKFFSQAGQDKLFVNEPVIGQVTGKVSIPLVRPILNQGKFDGVIIYSADAEKFVKLFSELDLGQLGVAALIRDDGLVLTRSLDMNLYVGKKIDAKMFNYPGAPIKGSYIRSSQTDQIKRIFSYYRLPQYGVTATVGISVEEALSATRRDALYSAIIGAILSVTLLLLTRIILHGIEARAAAEATRDQALAQMQALVAAAPIGIAMFDLAFRYSDINPVLASMNGLSREQHMGRLLREVLPQAGADAVAQIMTRVVETGESVSYELPLELPSDPGNIHHYSCSDFPVRAKTGEVIAVGALVQDITKQKHAEVRIHDLLNRLTVILQYAGDAIITISDSGEIESCNDAVDKLFGYSSAELIGQPIRLLTPQLSASDAIAAHMQMSSLRVTTGVHRAGHSVFLEVATSKINLQAQDKFILIMRDITEREKVARLQQEFVSTVSHELRTPLTSIRGALGLIEGGVAGVLPEKARALIEMANQNTLRLTRLINDLLDVQKLESGVLMMVLADYKLPDLINQAGQANSAYALSLGVQLSIAATLPEVLVHVDQDRFQQVMANLLSNACKFSGKDGVVKVSCVMASADRVRVLVQDSGPGIPDAFKSRIFQRFSQADGSNTKSRNGSGLGLAIAKAIITQMHGEIDYESIDGQGCCFYFELPVKV